MDAQKSALKEELTGKCKSIFTPMLFTSGLTPAVFAFVDKKGNLLFTGVL